MPSFYAESARFEWLMCLFMGLVVIALSPGGSRSNADANTLERGRTDTAMLHDESVDTITAYHIEARLGGCALTNTIDTHRAADFFLANTRPSASGAILRTCSLIHEAVRSRILEVLDSCVRPASGAAVAMPRDRMGVSYRKASPEPISAVIRGPSAWCL